MPEGKIKKLVQEKGFGFIDGEGADLFFHCTALQGISIEDLREGQLVRYDVGSGPKGPRAENIECL